MDNRPGNYAHALFACEGGTSNATLPFDTPLLGRTRTENQKFIEMIEDYEIVPFEIVEK